MSPGFFSNPVTLYEGFDLKTEIDWLGALDKNSQDLSTNIHRYLSIRNDLSNSVYQSISGDFAGPADVHEVAKNDIDEMIFQQNNTYIIAMITFTLLLLMTYLIIKE